MIEFVCQIPYCALPVSKKYNEICEECELFKLNESHICHCIHERIRIKRYCLKSYDEIEYPFYEPGEFEPYCVIKTKSKIFHAYRLWIDGKEIELEEE